MIKSNYTKDYPLSIQAMFNSIASEYDKANGILSWQLHKQWNRQLINQVLKATQPKIFMDLCCGTGEIALTWLKQQNTSKEVYLLDFCENMLIQAKHKAQAWLPGSPHQLHFLQADAHQLPLEDCQLDCITVAYGIRNLHEPSRCFKEVSRVLKTNGIFGILELTQPQNSLLKKGHTFYLNYILPKLGGWVTRNPQAYQYLCESISTFIQPNQLIKQLATAGLSLVSHQPLWGGIATLIIAKKRD